MNDNPSPFSARTLALLIVAGIVGFAAFLLLVAYAPDLRSGQNGRAHGLSTSAVGFRGIAELLDSTGAEIDYVRDENERAITGLTIVTLEQQTDPERLATLIANGRSQPTLIVLPKWATVPIMGERDRVQSLGPLLGASGAQQLRDIVTISTSVAEARPGSPLGGGFTGADLRVPASLQVIEGKGITGIVETLSGEIVLASIDGTASYILSDPDLLNNQILRDPERARAALMLLGSLNRDNGPYRFELVLNGFGGAYNLLTLAFEPPFLALTLCILAAALLAGFHALYRFGPALRPQRAIAFGKRALVDNSAELLRLARREHLSSERYVAMTREAAVAAIGNPRKLSGSALDQWLDGLGPKSMPPFTTLAAAAQRATGRQDILNAARALHHWRKAVTHEG
jgi:hypothetical protein